MIDKCIVDKCNSREFNAVTSEGKIYLTCVACRASFTLDTKTNAVELSNNYINNTLKLISNCKNKKTDELLEIINQSMPSSYHDKFIDIEMLLDMLDHKVVYIPHNGWIEECKLIEMIGEDAFSVIKHVKYRNLLLTHKDSIRVDFGSGRACLEYKIKDIGSTKIMLFIPFNVKGQDQHATIKLTKRGLTEESTVNANAFHSKSSLENYLQAFPKPFSNMTHFKSLGAVVECKKLMHNHIH